MAKYYCCTRGDIFRAALPSGLKIESKSKIFATGNEAVDSLSEKEALFLEQLGSDVSTVEEIQKKLGNDFSYSALKSLMAKEFIAIEEKISSRYKPKTEGFVKLHPEIKTEIQLEEKIKLLGRAQKQKALLFHSVDKMHCFEENQLTEISKKELFNGTNFSTAILNELVKKKLLVHFQKQVSRIEEKPVEQVSINLLNQYQEKALAEIKISFEKKQVTLIHGITASGKTEIYIHLIDEALKAGKQALYLVPEIALTTQIVQRLKQVFGKKVGIYHSRLNSQERVEIWEKVLQFQHQSKRRLPGNSGCTVGSIYALFETGTGNC